MSTYAFRDASGDLVASFPEFARPIPAHAQTEAALAAVESARAHGRAARLDRVVAGLVLEHGNPAPVEPYDGDVVTASARAMVKLAESRGFEIRVVELADRCVVSGFRPDCGFSAEWLRGRASSGTWHEPRRRYAIIDDPRPEPVASKLTRLSLAGKRPVGVPKRHLTIVASPTGVKVGVAGITERIKAL
jgi:hypothetical protein